MITHGHRVCYMYRYSYSDNSDLNDLRRKLKCTMGTHCAELLPIFKNIGKICFFKYFSKRPIIIICIIVKHIPCSHLKSINIYSFEHVHLELSPMVCLLETLYTKEQWSTTPKSNGLRLYCKARLSPTVLET